MQLHIKATRTSTDSESRWQNIEGLKCDLARLNERVSDQEYRTAVKAVLTDTGFAMIPIFNTEPMKRR